MPSLPSLMRQFRRAILARDAQAQAAMRQTYEALWPRIRAELDRLTAQMQAAIDNGEDIKASWLYEQNRLQTVLDTISRSVGSFSTTTRAQVGMVQGQAINDGVATAQGLLGASVPLGVTYAFASVPAPVIQHSIGALQPGTPLYALFDTFAPDAAKAAKLDILSGVSLGKGPREIARDVRDSLQMPLARAQTIARTEVLRSWRIASSEQYKANADIMDGWIWSASANACVACLAMQGTEHDVSETLESHPNCCCAMLPKTKSWSDILGPLGIDTSGLEDTRPDIPSGEDVFNGFTTEQQRDRLGPLKYAAWKNGDIAFSDLAQQTDSRTWGGGLRVATLAELGIKKGA